MEAHLGFRPDDELVALYEDAHRRKLAAGGLGALAQRTQDETNQRRFMAYAVMRSALSGDVKLAQDLMDNPILAGTPTHRSGNWWQDQAFRYVLFEDLDVGMQLVPHLTQPKPDLINALVDAARKGRGDIMERLLTYRDIIGSGWMTWAFTRASDALGAAFLERYPQDPRNFKIQNELAAATTLLRGQKWNQVRTLLAQGLPAATFMSLAPELVLQAMFANHLIREASSLQEAYQAVAPRYWGGLIGALPTNLIRYVLARI